MAESFQILSTMRFEPELLSASEGISSDYPDNSQYYLLSFHFDRMLAAAQDFGWEKAIGKLQQESDRKENIMALQKTLDEFVPDRTHAWRLRVLLSQNGELKVEKVSTTPFSEHILLIPKPVAPDTRPTFSYLLSSSTGSLPVWSLRLDTQSTPPSKFTRHKTTSRDAYNTARTRAGILSLTENNEVLLYNPEGEVMDGSITSLYFKRPSEGGATWVTPPLSSGGTNSTTRRYALESGLCEQRVVKVDDLADGEEVWLSNGARGFMRAVLDFNAM